MRVARFVVMIVAMLAMALLLATPALAASSFPDVPSSNPYHTAIDGLAARDIVGGYGSGNFGPNDLVKRMQFAKMIVLTMDYTVTPDDQSTFKDTPAASPSDPLYPGSYVAVATAKGVIQGYPTDNTFRFYNNITREQVATLVVRAAGARLATPPATWRGELDYSDPTHGQNLRIAEYNGLLAGLEGLSFSWKADQNATRAECAQILWNLVVLMEPHNKWTDLGPAFSPTPRGFDAMAYDTASGQVILFGGSGESSLLNDTFAYDSVTRYWSLLQPSGTLPVSRGKPSMAYDASIGKVIMFGGYTTNGGDLNDTWAYDPVADTWTNLSPGGPLPPAREYASLVYDPATGKLILFGGSEINGGAGGLNDTWAYDPAANTWTNLNPSGPLPSARSGHAMAYDPATGKLIIFGGWEFGGGFLNDTWAYDPAANTWANLSPSGVLPSARWGHVMAYDPATGQLILFGGSELNVDAGALNDTWAYDPAKNTWASLSPLNSPPARDNSSMVYDSLNGRMIIFGGMGSNSDPLDDTWAYNP